MKTQALVIKDFSMLLFSCCLRDSDQVGWNRTATNSGKKGTNIAIDTDTKQWNNCIKQGNTNLGPNVTENAVLRLSHKESTQTSILGNLKDSIKWLLQYNSFKDFQNLD